MVGVVRHRNHSYPLENWQRCFLFIRSNRSKPIPAGAMYTFFFFIVANPEFSHYSIWHGCLSTQKYESCLVCNCQASHSSKLLNNRIKDCESFKTQKPWRPVRKWRPTEGQVISLMLFHQLMAELGQAPRLPITIHFPLHHQLSFLDNTGEFKTSLFKYCLSL